MREDVCVCVSECVRACVHACVRVCVAQCVILLDIIHSVSLFQKIFAKPTFYASTIGGHCRGASYPE